VELPKLPDAGPDSWLTVRAVLARDEPWADAGHEVAWGQAQVTAPAPTPSRRPGFGQFDPRTGLLTRIGDVPVDGPRLDLWRAPTDNDEPTREVRDAVAREWRRIGLHRLRHRLIDAGREGDAYVVRTRVAPAATDLGVLVTYRWIGDDERLELAVQTKPVGPWSGVLPRVGLRMAGPAAWETVQWFGGGPGEAYADSRRAARIGNYTTRIDDLQTPYVFPQENGNRVDVRWARITAPDGSGIRVDGLPTFDLTARRWTSEDLDAARHTYDLRPRDRVYVNLDLAQNGLGTASCGPGVLPQYRLAADRGYTFALAFGRL
jgi:beta-galactosidase